MRKLRLGLVTAFLATALLALPSVAAANRTFSFWGPSFDVPACNQDLKVGFDAIFHKGKWERLQDFRIKDMNFPNTTPPVPFGRRTGDCVPGEHVVTLLNYRLLFPAVISFRNPHDPNVFDDSEKLVIQGLDGPHVIEAWEVAGKIALHHRHHEFHATAVGLLGYATSEAGLNVCNGNPCGASSGRVSWKARGHEVAG